MTVAESKKHDPIQGPIVHEYDGIEEADNQLPLWWLWTLYSAIAFAVVYWFTYQGFNVLPNPQQAYFLDQAKKLEKEGGDLSNEQLLAQVGPASVQAGQQVFLANCVACHNSHGQGKIGPNLTDAAWLHGGEPQQIWKTIKEGVPAKGMPPWGPVLGRAGVTQATAFVLSIRDTNVPGKAPEGQPVGAETAPQPEVPAPGTQGAATPEGAPQVKTAAAAP
jgi:cytochrome c oxidase cbb3-type subunit 3